LQHTRKRTVTHYEVSELFGNANLEVQTGKIATSGFRATGLRPLKTHFDAATEEHSSRAGALLSRKESAT
jgi:hypothetical protein